MRDVVVDADVIKEAVWLACRAPSLHNSQPWRWIAQRHAVQLFLDADRAPRSTDTSGREAVIGCGAVLDHFRVAMAAAGWATNVDRFPNPNNLDHLASVDFSPLDFVTDGHRSRAHAILQRRTDRLPLAAPANWESFLEQLRGTMDGSEVYLDVVAGKHHAELAHASQLAESQRLYDSSYHSEIIGWTSGFNNADGIPPGALLSATESDRVDIARHFPSSPHPERRPDVSADHANVLVLSTPDDTRRSALRCGEALSAVLLDATMAGMATCTLTHITEVAASRHVVATLIAHDAAPQVVVRVGDSPGTGDLIPTTPRRPIGDVLEVEPGSE